MRKTLIGMILAVTCPFYPMHGETGPPASHWRSALYPNDWTPEWTDPKGNFLHDFSFAGYQRSEVRTADQSQASIRRVTDAPYFADATGQSNAAPAIQKAINDAAAAGGGVVLIPAGRFKLEVPPGQKTALKIQSSGIILRGEGAATQLFTRETKMRDNSLIRVAPPVASWKQSSQEPPHFLVRDSAERSRFIDLKTHTGLQKGDAIIIRSDVTLDFAKELGMEGLWDQRLEGPHFYREIVDIDPMTGRVLVDVPLRFPLKVRDMARVHKVQAPLLEIGIENLAFGMAEQTIPGLGENDFSQQGTAGYQSHRAFLLRFNHVQHSWIHGISSFQLPENKSPVHLLSGGIALHQVRFITVDGSELSYPQYKGAGGNGYLFELQNAQEVLVKNSKATGGRHNFDVKSMGSSGIVFLRCEAREGYMTTDFHMHLSQAVLFDSMRVDGDQLEARYRDYGTMKHGQTSTQSVFWNTHGLRYRTGQSTIVHSQQWGPGFIIGTQGPAHEVTTPGGRKTEPVDWKEGIGAGENLDPPSLYEDQLRRRLLQRW
ncbi:MAG TPA: glycosyl hydrolase family 28-related protein [Oligoflexus sp.]|uniref:glycosyl hydrolase family 28-related protein n=1 Tax=Oligoflexus sp. TaxID=1971216 RepID=UPI002D2D42FD|nr:glycosyl hydrolase family 28-related protein [Oligoflexus sp.]HYX34711.1 glycosyl hydrolase family 28-related protein [Oligoflexus sp.]